MEFSANLGFLWTELSLVEAIHAAKKAGFSAVEFHWPYGTPAMETAKALRETGLALMGLNTRRGNVDEGENGLAAVPGREIEARDTINEAIAYATETGAGNIHVMAGSASGGRARDTFLANLDYACEQAKPHSIGILIEPLNIYDVPGYFLSTTTQATDIISTLNKDNLSLMFDCYHVQRMEGDITQKIKNLLPMIGHIQAASVPDRGRLDQGELSYAHIFSLIEDLGYRSPIGAEYIPVPNTEDSLGWMREFTIRN